MAKSTPSILVFDIETVPDVAGLRRLHNLSVTLTDSQVVKQVTDQRVAEGSSEFLPLYLQQIVAISCVIRRSTKEGFPQFKVGSLGHIGDDEKIFQLFKQVEMGLRNRIELLIDLPIETLNKLQIQDRLHSIHYRS